MKIVLSISDTRAIRAAECELSGDIFVYQKERFYVRSAKLVGGNKVHIELR